MKTRNLLQLAIITSVLALNAASALAAGANTGMPWESPLDMILNSITGPVAKCIGVLAIFGVGVAMAHSEGGGIMKKILNVVMGITVMFSASTFFLSLFGYGSGLGF
jgi:type IV secretion system protein TrbC